MATNNLNTVMEPPVPTIRSMARDRGITSMLLGGVEALWVNGDLQAGRDWFDAAYRAADTHGNNDAMAQAALGQAGMWVHEHRDPATALLSEARLCRALSAVEARSTLALRLRARLAAERDYRSGGNATILALLDEARSLTDPIAYAEAINMAHHCLLGPEHGALRERLTGELILAGLQTARHSDLLLGLLRRAVDLFTSGDPHAERGLAELRGRLGERDNLAVGYVVRAIDVMLDIRAGRLAQAESRASTCAEYGIAAGDADTTGWHGAQLVAIRWYQGRIADVLPALRDLADSPTLSAVDNSCLAALAMAEATGGDRRQAAGALARLRGQDLADMPRSGTWLVTMYGVIEAAHLLEDESISAAVYELLQPFARLPMMFGFGVACYGSVQYALGLASMTTGAYHRAVEHLRSAVQDNTALGHWPAVALARARLAMALDLRGDPGDAADAALEWQGAARDAAALRMKLPADLTARIAAGLRRGYDRDLPVLRRRGRQWEIRLGQRVAEVEHSRGVVYLAALVANPGHDIPAVDLAAGPGLANPVAIEAANTSPQPVLDQAAMSAYKRRLAELGADVEEYELMNDIAHAERARAERDWLIAELTTSAALAGKVRHFPASDERARVSVSKAIHRALAKIADADPIVGERLRASVRTGLRCSYQPL